MLALSLSCSLRTRAEPPQKAAIFCKCTASCARSRPACDARRRPRDDRRVPQAANRMRRPAAGGRQGYAALPKYHEDDGAKQTAAPGPHAALGPTCGPFCMLMLVLQVQMSPPTLP